MEIGPIKRNQLLSEELKSEKAPRQTAAEPKSKRDRLELSAEARREIESRPAQESDKQLVVETDAPITVEHNDRLAVIRSRISSGYYDQVAVKKTVIDRMIDEMLSNINEFYR